jgi:heme exporter protein A
MASGEGAARLRLHDLSCARAGMTLLEHIDLTLDQGQVVTLRGPNGIGKTTLLRTIAGLQPPLAGYVEVAPDASVYGGHADALKATLSVEENLRFWAHLFGTRDIEPALAAFGLGRLRHRLARDLSAGQKRRAGLARLMTADRPVWLLDEPTVSMDAASMRAFTQAVLAHCEAGGAAIIATHQDLGLPGRELDLTAFRATRRDLPTGFDRTFA